MNDDRKRILSHRSRTPGKALDKDDLASVTGGISGRPVPGCCVQGCNPCELPGVEPLPTGPVLPKWP